MNITSKNDKVDVRIHALVHTTLLRSTTIAQNQKEKNKDQRNNYTLYNKETNKIKNNWELHDSV
jgi:hypothetical protein